MASSGRAPAVRRSSGDEGRQFTLQVRGGLGCPSAGKFSPARPDIGRSRGRRRGSVRKLPPTAYRISRGRGKPLVQALLPETVPHLRLLLALQRQEHALPEPFLVADPGHQKVAAQDLRRALEDDVAFADAEDGRDERPPRSPAAEPRSSPSSRAGDRQRMAPPGF